uniref:Putative ovule protein n=1 Tax=Solanum chacoense TaxID=4108 RepID=A0A0V0IEH8_SOLCH
MIYYQQTNNQLVNLLEKQIIILTYLKFITNKGCDGVVSTPSSLAKRSRVRFPLGTESPLLLPPQCGTFRHESEFSRAPMWVPNT